MITSTKLWQETVYRFTTVTDRLGKPIDQGIFETVVALNVLGIETKQSCEGHLDWGLPHPWIDIELNIEQKYQLHQWLQQFYDQRQSSYDTMLILHGYRLRPTWAPFDALCTPEDRAQKLKKCRQEMTEFTQFLKNNSEKLMNTRFF